MILKKIKRKHLKKNNWFSEIEKNNKDIRKELEELFDNDGFAIAKKSFGKIRCVCTFEKIEEKHYKHNKEYYVEGVEEKTKKKFLKSIESLLVDNAAYGENVERVEFKDKEISTNKINIGKKSVALGGFLMTMGIVFYILNDNIWFLILGFGLASACGAVINYKNKK